MIIDTEKEKGDEKKKCLKINSLSLSLSLSPQMTNRRVK